MEKTCFILAYLTSQGRIPLLALNGIIMGVLHGWPSRKISWLLCQTFYQCRLVTNPNTGLAKRSIFYSHVGIILKKIWIVFRCWTYSACGLSLSVLYVFKLIVVFLMSAAAQVSFRIVISNLSYLPEPLSQFVGHSFSAPVTTGTTIDFTPHIFQLLMFFFLMLLALGIAASIMTAFFCCTSINMMCGLLAITSLSAWILKSHRILGWSFSTIWGGIFHSNCGTSSPYSVQMFLFTKPATWLWLLNLCCFCLHLTKPAFLCWTVS